MVDPSGELTLADVLKARHRIHPYVQRTPLVQARGLSRRTGSDIWLKCEFMLPTRAFKVRGGLNLVSHDAEFGLIGSSGLTAASTGNHGQSVAFAGQVFGFPVTIFSPENANPIKVESMEALGATVTLLGRDFDEARSACESFAERSGARYVHSMNEPLLIAGVGTAYLEALMSLPSADLVIVPIGGGSGVSAAGLVAKSINPAIRVIGVQAEGAPAVYRSFVSGKLESTSQVDTVAEGLATRVAFDLPLRMIRHYVDDIVLVTDEEMRQAQSFVFQDTRTFPEMAGAASAAAAIKIADTIAGSRVILSVTGANASMAELQQIWRMMEK